MEWSREYQERRERFRKDPDYILHGLLYDIAEDIYAAMEERGWSQSELAKRAGMKPSYLSRFLNTPTNTELRTVVRLATALGLKYEHHLVPLADEAVLGTPEQMAEAVDLLGRCVLERDAQGWQPTNYPQRGALKYGMQEREDGNEHFEFDAVA